ncbi:MAG: DUF2027 domain-containing protein [Bacteroidia bacterium]|nr:DUF2027 domain-containing protein [Bacteroidia bacterium]
MKFRIGDKVRYLNDVGGGTISEIIDHETVRILNEHDFEVPALASELVLIEKAMVSEDDEKNQKLIESSQEDSDKKFYSRYESSDKQEREEINIFFALVPGDSESDIISSVDAYLINDSEIDILYNYLIHNDTGYMPRENGTLEADTKIYLESYKREDFEKIKSFVFQFIIIRKTSPLIYKPFHKELTVNPVKLYKQGCFTENDFFEENAMLIPVVTRKDLYENTGTEPSVIDNIIFEKEELNKTLNLKPELKSNKQPVITEEVDLHIHNLVEYDYLVLSNPEKLNIQLEHFRCKLNEAIQKKIDKIVFIHGIGNGTLKLEIRKALDKEYPHLKYQDASFKEYGFGATLVMIKF